MKPATTLFTLSLCAGVALAADPPPVVPSVEVKGHADADDARRDDTASKIVVKHQEIIKYGDTNIVDVLRRLPGITVSGAPGRGGEIRMRGLGSGYTQILINGERAPAGFSLDALAPDTIETIEVLRAASAEHSTQSIAGTINIVLKKAVSSEQRELKPTLYAARGTTNTGLNVLLSDKLGQFSYSVATNFVYNRFAQSNEALEESVDASGRKVLQRETNFHEDGYFFGVFIVPRANWMLEGGNTLSYQGYINSGRYLRHGYSEVQTRLGLSDPFPHVADMISNSNDFVRSDLNWVHKTEGGGKLDAKIGFNIGQFTSDLQQRDAQPRLLDRVSGLVTDDASVTSTGKYNSAALAGHALAAGWDAGYAWHEDEREQFDPGVARLHEDSIAKLSRLALFAQDEWNLTPAWSLYAGLRWEGIRIRSAGLDYQAIVNRSSVWSPIFQTLFKIPDTKSQMRLALTRTYKAPAVQSLTPRRQYSITNTPTDPDRVGNPNLKPELATGLDASYEHYFAQGTLVSAAYTLRRISDYTRTSVELDGLRWVSRPGNDGDARTQSVELEAKFPLRALAASAPALDLRANIARNWSSVDNVDGPNNRLDRQTPVSGTLGLDYKNGSLSGGASYSFKTGGTVRVTNNQSQYQLVRRDLDAYALWKIDLKSQLRIAAQNLLQQGAFSDYAVTAASGVTNQRVGRSPGLAALRITYEIKL
jgi:outer membrane receptor for ferrienterochelin and colicins